MFSVQKAIGFGNPSSAPTIGAKISSSAAITTAAMRPFDAPSGGEPLAPFACETANGIAGTITTAAKIIPPQCTLVYLAGSAVSARSISSLDLTLPSRGNIVVTANSCAPGELAIASSAKTKAYPRS